MEDYVSTLQGRLGAVQDNLRRKLIDGTVLRHISSPIDCFRLRMRKNFKGDEKSWILVKSDIISVVFPEDRDIPFRKVDVDKETGHWSLTSLVDSFEEGQQQKRYQIQVPYKDDIDVDDILFRVMLDEDIDRPIIIPLQVKELLGTFGYMKMIMQKANCTIPTYDIPPECLAVIEEMAKRRKKIGF